MDLCERLAVPSAHGISLPALVLRGERGVGILYWTSPSIWNGTWVGSNLDYGGTIMDQFKEFVERRHKRNMINIHPPPPIVTLMN